MSLPRDLRLGRAVLPLALGVLLGLAGCQSDDPGTRRQATRTAQPSATNTTSDRGSRFLEDMAPVGGLAVETAPAEGTYVGEPTTALEEGPPAPPLPEPTRRADRSVTRR